MSPVNEIDQLEHLLLEYCRISFLARISEEPDITDHGVMNENIVLRV